MITWESGLGERRAGLKFQFQNYCLEFEKI